MLSRLTISGSTTRRRYWSICSRKTGGLPLVKRHPVQPRYHMVELKRRRDKRGLIFYLQPGYSPFDARLADGVVIAAIEAGFDPDPFLKDAFKAVWKMS